MTLLSHSRSVTIASKVSSTITDSLSVVARGGGELHFDDLRDLPRAALSLPRVIQLVLSVNVLFFVAWQICPAVMMLHAATGEINRREGRYWSLLLSSFSHRGFAHFLMNILSFLSLAPSVLESLGEKAFSLVIGIACIASGVFPVLYTVLYCALQTNYQKRLRQQHALNIGFSGVNYALIYLFATLHPNASMIIMTIKTNAKATVKGLLVFDLCGLLLSTLFDVSPISHSGHLGGLVGGWVARLILLNTSAGRTWLGPYRKLLLSRNILWKDWRDILNIRK